MTATERTVELVRFPLTMRLLTVRRVARLTPRLVRVTLAGDDLAGFASPDPDDHVKVFFPEPGAALPVVPTYEPDGIKLPADGRPLIARDYTPRRHDAAAGELDLDFVIHGDGPAATWAAQAAPGQTLGVAGPRGSHVVPPAFDWYLLCGDETVLPSIARRLEEFPAGARAIAFVEVADAAEEQALATRADLTLTWLHRDGAAPGTTDLLERAVRALDFPPGDPYVWASGEATSLRPLRRHLLHDRGLRREWCHFSGHWKRGAANHDHHAPLDE
jgi:NADPH-dependent ferric siderophore reductase